MRITTLLLLSSAALASASPTDTPVFEITPVESAIKFDVKASVAIAGKFDKWDATLTFTSPELSTAVLDKPAVWLFPTLLVYSDCGASQFMVPEQQLAMIEIVTVAEVAATREPDK
jgi:hypothetical protein